MTNNNSHLKPIPVQEWPSDTSVPYVVTGLDAGALISGPAILVADTDGPRMFKVRDNGSIMAHFPSDALFSFIPFKGASHEHMELERIARKIVGAATRMDEKAGKDAMGEIADWIARHRPEFMEKMSEVRARESIKRAMRSVNGEIDHQLVEAIVLSGWRPTMAAAE